MDSWNSIFKEKGKVFITPHPDMRDLANHLEQKGASRILDLGCGTGRHLLFFTKKGFEIYGLDASIEGITIARNWLTENELSCEITLNRMENAFPYENSFFDAIISIQAMHHNTIEKIQFTVSEMHRVLKPNGLIFITVPKRKIFKIKNRWKLVKIEKNTYIPLSGPEKGLPHHFFTKREIYKIFNGFNIKRIYLDETNHQAFLGFRKQERLDFS